MKRKLYGACAVTCRVSARPSCAHEGVAAARGVTRAYMSRVGSSKTEVGTTRTTPARTRRGSMFARATSEPRGSCGGQTLLYGSYKSSLVFLRTACTDSSHDSSLSWCTPRGEGIPSSESQESTTLLAPPSIEALCCNRRQVIALLDHVLGRTTLWFSHGLLLF